MRKRTRQTYDAERATLRLDDAWADVSCVRGGTEGERLARTEKEIQRKRERDRQRGLDIGEGTSWGERERERVRFEEGTIYEDLRRETFTCS